MKKIYVVFILSMLLIMSVLLVELGKTEVEENDYTTLTTEKNYENSTNNDRTDLLGFKEKILDIIQNKTTDLTTMTDRYYMDLCMFTEGVSNVENIYNPPDDMGADFDIYGTSSKARMQNTTFPTDRTNEITGVTLGIRYRNINETSEYGSPKMEFDCEFGYFILHTPSLETNSSWAIEEETYGVEEFVWYEPGDSWGEFEKLIVWAKGDYTGIGIYSVDSVWVDITYQAQIEVIQ